MFRVLPGLALFARVPVEPVSRLRARIAEVSVGEHHSSSDTEWLA